MCASLPPLSLCMCMRTGMLMCAFLLHMHVSIYMNTCTWYSGHVDVIRQLVEVDSLLHHMCLREQTQVVKLGSKHPYY